MQTAHLGIPEKKKSYPCAKCSQNVIAKNKIEYSRHIILCTGPPQKQCCQCQEIFDTDKQLRQHFDALHVPLPKKQVTSKKKKWWCEYCNKMFHFKMSLELHCKNSNYKEILSKDVPKVCEDCGKECKNTYTYNIHRQIFHLDESLPKIYNCTKPGCTRSFSLRPLLRKHLRYHNKKKYQCSYCDSAYFCDLKLQKHLETLHKDSQLLTCSVCCEVFLERKLYEKHLMQHK